MANPVFKIMAYPDFQSVAPGAVVTYKAEPVNPYSVPSMATQFAWYCINDKKTLPEGKNKFVIGPGKKDWEEARWSWSGRHTILLKVKYPDGQTLFVERREWIDTMANIIGREFNPFLNDNMPGPFAVLEYKKNYLKVLKDIAREKPPKSDQKEEHDQIVEQSESYIEHLSHNLEGLEAKESFTVDAFHMDKVSSSRSILMLSLFNVTGANRRPKWVLVDWTNPLYKHTAGRYEGSGATHLEAIENVISDWDSGNRYPEGLMHVDFKIPKYGIDIVIDFETDGKSFWDEVSTWLDYIAMGAMIVAGIVTLIAPIPGSRVLSAAIWVSIFASTTSATINIVQRHSEGYGNLKDDVFDGLTIVGNIFAGAGMTWRAGATFRSATLLGSKMYKGVIIGQVVTDGLQAAILSVDYYVDYQRIMDDPNLSPDSRLKKLLQLFTSAAATGAFTYISIKGSKADMDNFTNKKTYVSPEDLQNPKKVIYLDDMPKKVDVTDSNKKIKTSTDSNQQSPKKQSMDVTPVKLKPGRESFREKLEALVKKRAEEIINNKADINKNTAICTSRSGIEEFDFITLNYENLGGKKYLSPSKPPIPGVVKNIEPNKFKITDIDEYMDHVKDLYNSKGNPLHPDMEALIRSHIETQMNTKGSFDNNYGLPGLHSEVQAVNEIFHKIGSSKTFDLSKIDVATYKTQGGEGQGARKDACFNCTSIIPKEINIFTGRIKLE